MEAFIFLMMSMPRPVMVHSDIEALPFGNKIPIDDKLGCAGSIQRHHATTMQEGSSFVQLRFDYTNSIYNLVNDAPIVVAGKR